MEDDRYSEYDDWYAPIELMEEGSADLGDVVEVVEYDPDSSHAKARPVGDDDARADPIDLGDYVNIADLMRETDGENPVIVWEGLDG